jgi:hypothetical protein
VAEKLQGGFVGKVGSGVVVAKKPFFFAQNMRRSMPYRGRRWENR